MPRRTVARAAEVAGTGLFTGAPCRVRVAPGPAGEGIRFLRGSGAALTVIPALARHRVPAEHRTALAVGPERIDTVEHLLAAVWALELDDLDLWVEGPEVPIMDGSFAPFVALLDQAGTAALPGPRRRLRTARRIELTHGTAQYTVVPADELTVDVTIDYRQPVIGRQSVVLALPRGFRAGLAGARTFGFQSDIEWSQARGTLVGAVDGAGLGLEDDRVVYGVPRWPDEFVRHKAGDLVGDLALLGARLGGQVTAYRPSHDGNIACVHAIQAAALIVEVE